MLAHPSNTTEGSRCAAASACQGGSGSGFRA